MVQDQSGTPAQRAQVEKFIDAIRMAILDASPTADKDKDKHFVDMDAFLSALAHVIAHTAGRDVAGRISRDENRGLAERPAQRPRLRSLWYSRRAACSATVPSSWAVASRSC